MKRPTLIVLVLALLIAIAFLLRREPREQKPEHPPARPPVVEAGPPKTSDAIAPTKPSPASATAAAAAAIDAPAASSVLLGSVRGVVRLGGPAPKVKMYKVQSDPKCAAIHGPKIALDEFLVDPYGKIQWAFVYVKSGITGPVPPAPKTPVILDQVACVFTPHVLGIRAGQPLLIVNSDDLLHTVHAIPFVNKEFNFGLQKGMEDTKTFGKPEVMLRIKCDIHPWMRAWIGVLDHPYFAITNAVGSFVIRDLPPGNYQIEAWHEKCEPVALPIGVGPGRESLLDFVLDEKKE